MAGRHNASRAVSMYPIQMAAHKQWHPVAVALYSRGSNTRHSKHMANDEPINVSHELHTRMPSRTNGIETHPAGLRSVWGWEREHRSTTW